jgi:hypothetical protein
MAYIVSSDGQPLRIVEWCRSLGKPVAFRRVPALVDLATQPFVLLTLVHFSVLALRLPLLASLPFWFFEPRVKAVGPPSLIIALAALPLAAWLIMRRLRARPVLVLGAFVWLGFALQQGFAWSEGHGLDGMRNRIVTTGHAEFATIAVQQPSMWDVLVAYDAKLRHDELGTYAHSKPPGQLLFYMATDRLAGFLTAGSGSDRARRLDTTRTFAAIVWPLLSYAVLFPLFFVLRPLVGDETALIACLLYLVVPAVVLITLHTDQVLFPCLFMTTIWLATTAERRGSWRWAIATGAALYISTFFTFALILAAPLAAAFALATALQAADDGAPHGRVRGLARTALGAAIGFGVMFGVFAVAFHYDFVGRLREATSFHESWKGPWGGIHDTVYFAWLDYLEFAVWLGLPIAILTVGAVRRAILLAVAGQHRALVWPAIALLAVILYLGFFSHTKAEAARLWLPLVPMCCALAATELHERNPTFRATMVTGVLALQWLTVLLTKMGQDFW